MSLTMKDIQEVPSRLAVPSDLNEKKRQEVITHLNTLVADAFALYVKSKSFHWHMYGSHFRDYHLLCDEQADQIFAMIDVLAERARKLGGVTIRSIGQINRLKNVEDDEGKFLEPEKMLQQLMEDNRKYAERMRVAHQACDEANDVATASFLEIFLDETERRIWFLYETTRS